MTSETPNQRKIWHFYSVLLDKIEKTYYFSIVSFGNVSIYPSKNVFPKWAGGLPYLIYNRRGDIALCEAAAF
jgi:hypothetical protein